MATPPVSLTRRFRILGVIGASAWLLLSACAFGAPAAPVVMLKLDDLYRAKPGSPHPVSEHWQRVTDFLESQKLKANYGIFASSLEGECPQYVDWLKKRVASGQIEIWHHAYYGWGGLPKDLQVDGRTGEWMGGTAAAQAETFQKSFKLIKEKLGLDVAAFGPHATPTDGATFEALEGFPQIRAVWFANPPAGTKTSKLVIKRLMNLEQPIFFPNPGKVKADFEKQRATLPYVAIQGHPDQWDDARFEKFKQTVLYLKDQGCKFVTISEYLASQPGVKK